MNNQGTSQHYAPGRVLRSRPIPAAGSWTKPRCSAGHPPGCCGCPGRGPPPWPSCAPARCAAGAAATLARKLTDAGLAHPQPPELPARPDVTVLIPVRDRPVLLDRCLAALGAGYPVLVVDDGSADPAAVAAVAAAHRARLLRRPANGGPGAARNTGLAEVTSDLIAFLDSDCVPEPDWIERLAAHLADPAVAAAAPRIVPLPAGPGWAGRYTAASSCLDLGDQPARVAPGHRVGLRAHRRAGRAARRPGRPGPGRMRCSTRGCAGARTWT